MSFLPRCRHMLLAVLTLALLAPSPARATERRIDTWLVCGTFDHADGKDFEKDFIGEGSIQPGEGLISADKPWRFFDDRLYCRNMDDYNDLYTFFSSVRPGSPAEPINGCMAYVHTYVWSPAARDAELRIGANDGYRAWLNGKLVHSVCSLMRRAVRDQDHIPVKLDAGWNRLLLKIANGRGIWGFYANLCDAAGAPLAGLAYSVSRPEAPLAIVTRQLPGGFVGQPYVWLAINGAEPAAHTPSASPFRFMAAGGKPPYRWSPVPDAALPPGLWLDGTEGELHGVCAAIGAFPLEVRLTDAAGRSVQTQLTMTVADRPTRWLEDGKIGGLIHGAPAGDKTSHGDPQQQAELMTREGYSYGAITIGYSIAKRDWPGYYKPEHGEGFTGHLDASSYVKAFREHGIRFAAYVALPEPDPYIFDGKDFTYWPRMLDFLHAHLESMCVEYQPALFFLDGITLPGYIQASDPVSAQKGWDVDALFSIVKTVTPECLMMANSSYDDIAGDADMTNTEGNNDTEAYWSRWPMGQSGRNPKYVPIASWRYPFSWAYWEGTFRIKFRKPNEPDYQDWDEWARVVVTLIGEGFIADLDHTAGQGREEMHARLGDWLQPRLPSLVGTHPSSLAPADWGFALRKGDKIYLHILKNARGKTGWQGGDILSVAPLAAHVLQVRLFPQSTALPFKQDGASLQINLQNVTLDPVDTIIEIDVPTPQTGDLKP